MTCICLVLIAPPSSSVNQNASACLDQFFQESTAATESPPVQSRKWVLGSTASICAAGQWGDPPVVIFISTSRVRFSALALRSLCEPFKHGLDAAFLASSAARLAACAAGSTISACSKI